MSAFKPKYSRAADLVTDWKGDVQSGKKPILFPAGGSRFDQIQIGPGLVTLFGGAPGMGKTALTMQLVIDALRLNQQLKAIVCNVEMSPPVLLDRQLARLSGIDLSDIRHRRLDKRHAERLGQGIATLESLADRLAFLRTPFQLRNVAAAMDDFEADLVCLDYIQRIESGGKPQDRRSAIDESMSQLRRFADAGIAVMVVAAVSRTKDTKGRSSYDSDGLGLASFRESSELEFGADDAFILTRLSDDSINLRHLKSRYGETRDLPLEFDRPLQRFEVRSSERPSQSQRQSDDLAARWEQTAAAGEDS